jgi:hypothetical protein
MKNAFVIAFACLFFIGSTNALESSQYFTIDPSKTHKCIYINSPQDLGLTTVEKSLTYVIEAEKNENPWIDTTYNEVVINPGVLNKNPLCFYPPEREEGKFSSYKIRLYSEGLGISRAIEGGFCISKQEDVDSFEAYGEDICRMMSDNADIFDIQFRYDLNFAKPGDTLTKTIFLTSYANLRITLALATSLQSDFTEQTFVTSPEHPLVTKNFKIKVPNKEGNYSLVVLAEVEGCDLTFCRKEAESLINVKSDFVRKGFIVSVVPRNINLKRSQRAWFKVLITNYDEAKEFTIEASSKPSLEIDPKMMRVDIGKNKEKTVTFGITPKEDEQKLYRLYFNVKTEGEERSLSAYLTIGELLSDALREVSDLSKEDPEIRNEIQKAYNEWKYSYESKDYGDDLDDYKKFKDTLDKARATSENKTSPGPTGPSPPEPPNEFNWMWMIIPIVIVVIILIFVIYKKSRVVEEFEYPKYE